MGCSCVLANRDSPDREVQYPPSAEPGPSGLGEERVAVNLAPGQSPLRLPGPSVSLAAACFPLFLAMGSACLLPGLRMRTSGAKEYRKGQHRLVPLCGAFPRIPVQRSMPGYSIQYSIFLAGLLLFTLLARADSTLSRGLSITLLDFLDRPCWLFSTLYLVSRVLALPPGCLFTLIARADST